MFRGSGNGLLSKIGAVIGVMVMAWLFFTYILPNL